MIYVISGNKGGVGKSLTCTALIDIALQQNLKVILVDSDPHNPDVYKSHAEEISSHALDLGRNEGWIDLINVLDQNRDAAIIINCPAGANVSMVKFGGLLTDAIVETKHQLHVLWVINRNRDGLESLKELKEAHPAWSISVIRNNYFGTPEKFELFNSSKLKLEIEAFGGKVIDLPDLADRVGDMLSGQRMSISKANVNMNLGNRMELQRWRNATRQALAVI